MTRWMGLLAGALALAGGMAALACGGGNSKPDATAEPTATLVANVHSTTAPRGTPFGPGTSNSGSTTPSASTTGTTTVPAGSATPGGTPESATTSASTPGSTEPAAAAPTVAPANPTAVPPSSSSSTIVARLRIPALGVNHPIEQLGLVPGRYQLDTPHNPTGAIGWYSIYDPPGAGANAIFSAHVNYNGVNGPFANLAQLGAGSEIVAVMDDGAEYRYSVFANQRYVISADYANGDYPVISMEEVLYAPGKPAGEEWVTLITCSCEPGRILDPDGDGFGDCVDRDVVIARRIS